MDLHQTVRSNDFTSFNTLLENGADVTQLNHGNTLLHSLAESYIEPNLVKSLVSIIKHRPTLVDWLIEIERYISKKHILDFVLIQNNHQNTCMHVAIEKENWAFAGLVQNMYLNYRVNQNYLRKNYYGLNEYEYFLFNYGFNGFKNYRESLFWIDTQNNILTTIKCVSKAIKIVKVENNFYYLHNKSSHFNKVIEIEYPNPLASFATEIDFISFCKEKDLQGSINMLNDKALNKIKDFSEKSDNTDLTFKINVDLMNFMLSQGLKYDEYDSFMKHLYTGWQYELSESQKKKIYEPLVKFQQSLNRLQTEYYSSLLNKMIEAWK